MVYVQDLRIYRMVHLHGDFVPMNANFGIIEPLGYRVKGGKVAKNQALAERALSIIDEMKNNF